MKKGKLEIITGCMFAGKTEELLRRAKRLELANKLFYMFKPDIDVRYDENKIVSHNGNKNESIVVSKLYPRNIINFIYDNESKQIFHTIFIDEVQFFTSDIISTIKDILSLGINVVVSGLNLDFKEESFPNIKTLMCLADSITILKAVCVKCGRDANRTQRLTDGKPASIFESVEQVGGKESYEARCKDCLEINYDKETQEKILKEVVSQLAILGEQYAK